MVWLLHPGTMPLLHCKIVQGPGQLFVGATSALFIAEGSSDLANSVNAW